MAKQVTIIKNICNHKNEQKKCPDFMFSRELNKARHGICRFCDSGYINACIHPNPTELIKEKEK